MRPSRAPLKRQLGYIVAILAMLLAAFLSITGPGGYLDVKKARADLEEMKARVSELERANWERLRTIRSLKSDDNVLEEYARQKGYARRHEIIQQLSPEPSSSPRSSGENPSSPGHPTR